MRTFVAVDVSGEVVGRARRIIDRMKKSGVEARWTPPENMHITLKFLGDVPVQRSADICRVIGEVAQTVEPFSFTCHGAGGYPNAERPRVLWMGVTEGRVELIGLREIVEERLADIGFRVENRGFQPHLTLGRMRRSRDEKTEVGAVLESLSDFPGGETWADELTVYSSELDRRRGATFNVLARVPIGSQ
jgi:2'-5' RNA ligase